MAPLRRRSFIILQLFVTILNGLYSGVVGSSIDDLGVCASFITPHGYTCNEFHVTTKDGYILSVQRISEGRFERKNTNKQPVILQHGVLIDGIMWLLNSPEQNLPMIMADNGFDVWIVNSRGTKFSRSHTSLDSSSPSYWNWSLDELVLFDLTAVFNFVSQHTSPKKIDFVGHSMGTMMILASLSEGRLVDQLRSAALMSPVAYLSHITTAIGALAAQSPLGETFTLMGIAEFNPRGPEVVTKFLKPLCAHSGINCYDLLSSFYGKSCCLNSSTINLFLKNEPQSSSTKTMLHLAQNFRTGVFAKFDYERSDYNMIHYGKTSPPIYNISNIPNDLPLFITYGGQDAVSDVQDVGLLLDHLKFHDVDKLSVKYLENYAHADFIMGVNAKDDVYRSMLSFFNRLPPS